MPSPLSEKDIQELREDLLRLKNVMHDLRAESFARVCKRAEVALGELLDMVKRCGARKERNERDQEYRVPRPD